MTKATRATTATMGTTTAAATVAEAPLPPLAPLPLSPLATEPEHCSAAYAETVAQHCGAAQEHVQPPGGELDAAVPGVAVGVAPPPPPPPPPTPPLLMLEVMLRVTDGDAVFERDSDIDGVALLLVDSGGVAPSERLIDGDGDSEGESDGDLVALRVRDAVRLGVTDTLSVLVTLGDADGGMYDGDGDGDGGGSMPTTFIVRSKRRSELVGSFWCRSHAMTLLPARSLRGVATMLKYDRSCDGLDTAASASVDDVTVPVSGTLRRPSSWPLRKHLRH
jgi:hypothetical protein